MKARNNKKNRQRLLKIYGHLYRRVSNLDLSICAYCGDKRQCLDHVPPIIMMDNIDVDKYMEDGGKLLLYPSCLECNSKLGANKDTEYIERLMFLESKYDKMLQNRELWTTEELNELGGNLRQMIEGKNEETKRLTNKLQRISDIITNYWIYN